MREIKFKFWLGHTQKMTYEHSLIEISNLFWDFTEDIIPLQYIGINDANNKEIYEGDILKRFGNYYIVVYEGMGYRMIWTEEDMVNRYPDEKCEVIGNIYENPELVEYKVGEV